MKCIVAMTAVCVVAFSTAQANGQAGQPVIPDEIIKEWQGFVGEWKAEGQGARGVIKGTWKATWAPGKQCLLIDYRGSVGDEAFIGSAIWGWDSSKDEFLVVSFYSNDILEIIRTKVESPGVYKGTHMGHAKGKPSKAKAELNKPGPNEWTFKATEATIGGEEAPDLTVRFVRAGK